MSPVSKDPLEVATRALARSDRSAALEALLGAWRTRRCAAVEEIVEIVSKDLARAHAPIVASAKALDAAFTARAMARDLGDLPHLLQVLDADPKGTLPLRLRALLDWPTDPRLGAKLLEMIDEPPITSSSNFPMWTMLFSALPSYVDARAEGRLRARAKKSGGTSKFWPKLTAWIEKALPQLAAPATPTPEERERLGALKKRALELSKEPVETATTTKPSPSSPSKTGAKAPKAASAGDTKATNETQTPRGGLEVAHRAVNEGDFAMALGALVTFWGERRAPAIAELIETLGRAIDVTLPSLEVGKPAEIHAAWLAIGRAPKATDVGRLLGSVTAGKLVDAEERLASVLQWPPDPRVGRRLALLFEDFLLGSRPVLWRFVYDALVHHADPRQRELIVARGDAMENRNAAVDRVRSERQHLRRTREAFTSACDRPSSLTLEETALVTRISEATTKVLAKRAGESDDAGRDERALVRAIAEAMDEDAPRSVYADLLAGRGDPRGEYLAMALADASGKAKLKSKLAAFEKTHRAALHGALAPLVYKSEHARGLLASISVTDKAFDWNDAATVDRLFADLRWCTLRAMTFWLFGDARRAPREILGRAPLWALRDLGNTTLDELAVFAARGPSTSLGSVGLAYQGDRTDREETWVKLDQARFPGLQALGLTSSEPPDERLLAVPAFRRLQRLEAGARHVGGIPDLAGWAKLLRVARFPVPDVIVVGDLCTFEWHGGGTDRPSSFRFHRALARGEQDSYWAPILTQATALVASGGLTWTTDPGVDLGVLAPRLEALGARRGDA